MYHLPALYNPTAAPLLSLAVHVQAVPLYISGEQVCTCLALLQSPCTP